jgi:integrase
MKNYKKLPSLKDLELVGEKIKHIRNRRGEFLRKVHYGCYLLCSESGLRISEAVKFDLNAKTGKGLYRIKKTKGKKERLVYVSPAVIKELKNQN